MQPIKRFAREGPADLELMKGRYFDMGEKEREGRATERWRQAFQCHELGRLVHGSKRSLQGIAEVKVI